MTLVSCYDLKIHIIEQYEYFTAHKSSSHERKNNTNTFVNNLKVSKLEELHKIHKP